MRALLRDALRTLRARPGATLVAHTGLALALAASLLVALLALALAQTDASIPEPERIVLLDFQGNPPGQRSDWFLGSPLFFGPALKARGVALQHIARAQDSGFTLRRAGGGFQAFSLLLADPDLVPLMGLRALHGDLQATLSQPDAVAITLGLVEQLWGELPPQQALGRILSDGGKSLRVSAIVPDFDTRHPLHGHQLIAGFEGQANGRSAAQREAIFVISGRVFARLKPGAQVDQVGAWMRQAFLAHPELANLPKDWTQGREAAFFRGLGLPQLRFESERARWQQIGALGAACALLLLMAAVNAFNLLAAQLLQRQRETALRQSLGAARVNLLSLWAAEQGLALLVAGAMAWLLAWWLAPALVAWLGLPANTQLFAPWPWAVLGGLIGVLALLLPLTLALPATLGLAQAPARALQGRTASAGPWGRRLRQSVLAVQLGGALLLLALTGVLVAQHQHLLQADRGYSVENRLVLDMDTGTGDPAGFAPLVQAIAQHPAVQSWSFSDMKPPWGAQSHMQEQMRRPQQPVGPTLRVNQVSPGFFTTFGIRVLAGDPRHPLQGEERLVIDAEAASLLGFAEPQQAVGQVLLGKGDFLEPGQAPRRIIAVVANAKLETGRELSQARAYLVSEAFAPILSLHGPDTAAMRSAVEQLWKRFDLPHAYRLDTVQEQLSEAHRQEGQLAGLLGALALLAVVVAVAGAHALVADTLRRRRTELVLRRLHGAAGIDIVRSVASEFRAPLGLALLLALPLAAWLGQRYQAGFVDRAPIASGLALPLAAAAALTLLVLTLAAWRHTRIALALRPIEALS